MADTRENIQTDTRPRLDDPGVVDGLVRRFTAHALDILQPPRGPTFMAAIDFECRRMNSLFLTITPNDDYERSDWNDPHELGMYIRGWSMIDGDIRYGVRDAFMQYLDRVVDAIKRNESAEPLIEPLVSALLGTASAPESAPRRS
jgi:hypothetical protein